MGRHFDVASTVLVRTVYDSVVARMESTHRSADPIEKAKAKTRIVSALIQAMDSGERDREHLFAIASGAIDN